MKYHWPHGISRTRTKNLSRTASLILIRYWHSWRKRRVWNSTFWTGQPSPRTSLPSSPNPWQHVSCRPWQEIRKKRKHWEIRTGTKCLITPRKGSRTTSWFPRFRAAITTRWSMYWKDRMEELPTCLSTSKFPSWRTRTIPLPSPTRSTTRQYYLL